jgi:hypothetical protein
VRPHRLALPPLPLRRTQTLRPCVGVHQSHWIHRLLTDGSTAARAAARSAVQAAGVLVVVLAVFGQPLFTAFDVVLTQLWGCVPRVLL